MGLSDRQLQRAYRHFNKKWFDNKLPQEIDTLFSPVDNDLYGYVEMDDNGDWILQINPKYFVDSRIWKMVLLHEMCHIKLYPDLSHGKKWQSAMVELAGKGAFRNLW